MLALRRCDRALTTSNDSAMHFAHRLAYARAARELTMREVAERGNLTQGQVSHLEAGHHDPKLPSLYRLAAGLDTTPWWLAGDGDVFDVPAAPAKVADRVRHRELSTDFGVRLARVRHERGLSQQQLADRIDGMAKRTIAAYEGAEKLPHLRSVIVLAEALDVPVRRLLWDH